LLFKYNQIIGNIVMTKFSKIAFVMALALAASLGLTACDDDDASATSNSFSVGNSG
jgi:hypothetical protein